VTVLPEVGRAYEVSVRVSVGVASWSERMTDGAVLVAAADEALFEAKAAGRDRVVASSA
jgi:diguanylate cyclase (GGDEF)-like protein